MAWEWSCVLGDGRTFDALWLGTLLRDANRLQRLCLGRRIVRDLDALLQPELGALRACHGIGFTEGLVLYRPSTDRLWRNAKVASGVLHQSAGGNQRADFLAEFRRELRWAMRRTFRPSRGFCLWTNGVRH